MPNIINDTMTDTPGANLSAHTSGGVTWTKISSANFGSNAVFVTAGNELRGDGDGSNKVLYRAGTVPTTREFEITIAINQTSAMAGTGACAFGGTGSPTARMFYLDGTNLRNCEIDASGGTSILATVAQGGSGANRTYKMRAGVITRYYRLDAGPTWTELTEDRLNIYNMAVSAGVWNPQNIPGIWMHQNDTTDTTGLHIVSFAVDEVAPLATDSELLIQGDSIAYGTGAANNEWWRVANSDANLTSTGDWAMTMIAVGGKQLQTVVTEMATIFAGLIDHRYQRQVLYVHAGTNDVNAYGASAADLQGWVEDVIAAARNAGVWVIFGTMLARTGFPGAKETIRTTHNAYLLGLSEPGVAVADFTGISGTNDSAAISPKTITAGTHVDAVCTITSAGHGIAAGQKVTVTGCTPSTYNVTAATVSSSDTDTITYTAGGTPSGDITVGGSVSNVTLFGDGTHPNATLQALMSPVVVAAITGLPADITPPYASLTADNVTGASGGTSYTFTVTYTDADGNVDYSTIATGNVTVTGPGAFSQDATFVSATPASDASEIVATYSITPPDGAWNEADNGTYTVTMKPLSVYDDAAIPNPTGTRALGTFTVGVSDAATSYTMTASAASIVKNTDVTMTLEPNAAMGESTLINVSPQNVVVSPADLGRVSGTYHMDENVVLYDRWGVVEGDPIDVTQPGGGTTISTTVTSVGTEDATGTVVELAAGIPFSGDGDFTLYTTQLGWLAGDDAAQTIAFRPTARGTLTLEALDDSTLTDPDPVDVEVTAGAPVKTSVSLSGRNVLQVTFDQDLTVNGLALVQARFAATLAGQAWDIIGASAVLNVLSLTMDGDSQPGQAITLTRSGDDNADITNEDEETAANFSETVVSNPGRNAAAYLMMLESEC